MNDDLRAEGLSTSEPLRIAGWQVHAASNRISRGETTVKLEPRTKAAGYVRPPLGDQTFVPEHH